MLGKVGADDNTRPDGADQPTALAEPAKPAESAERA
jgi:hypothetical protein